MNKPTKFITKLYQILELTSSKDPVYWNKEGKSIIINRGCEFNKFLNEQFQCRKPESFLRQLGIYGFKMKINSQNQKEYQHKFFIQGIQSQLYKIQRTIKVKSQPENTINFIQENETLSFSLIQLKCNQEILLKKVKITFQIQILITRLIHQILQHFFDHFNLHQDQRIKKFKSNFLNLIVGYKSEAAIQFVQELAETINQRIQNTPITQYSPDIISMFHKF